jgi:hypothetical protein
MAGGSGPWSGQEFEMLVYQQFQQELTEYCRRARRPGRVDPAGLKIRILVVTGSPLEQSQPELRAKAEQIVEGELPHATLEPVAFALERGIGAPGFWFSIEPRLPDDTTDPSRGRQPHARPGPQTSLGPDEPTGEWSLSEGDAEESIPARPAAYLQLIYDTELTHRYPLYVTDDWIRVGRAIPSSPQRPAIRLPGFLRAVPRGALLELRYRLTGLALRRTGERPEYDVSVDGRLLRPGQGTGIGAQAKVRYSTGSGVDSLLVFQLREGE